MKLSKRFRQNTCNKLSNIESQVTAIKSLVENPVDITKDTLRTLHTSSSMIISELNELKDSLNIQVHPDSYVCTRVFDIPEREYVREEDITAVICALKHQYEGEILDLVASVNGLVYSRLQFTIRAHLDVAHFHEYRGYKLEINNELMCTQIKVKLTLKREE